MRWLYDVALFLTVGFFSLAFFLSSVDAQGIDRCSINHVDQLTAGQPLEVELEYPSSSYDNMNLTVYGEDVDYESSRTIELDENDRDGPSGRGTKIRTVLFDDLPPGSIRVRFSASIPNIGETLNCDGPSPIIVAQNENNPQPTAAPRQPSSSDGNVEIDFGSDDFADGHTPYVDITFNGLKPGEYKVCFKTDGDCQSSEYVTRSPTKGVLPFQNLCGDGNSALKQRDNGDEACDPDTDYFHEGHWYGVHLLTDDGEDSHVPGSPAMFYVRHHYPTVIFNEGEVVIGSSDGVDSLNIMIDGPGGRSTPTEANRISITNPFAVELESRVKVGDAKRNNYQLVLEGMDSNYQDADRHCVVIEGETGDPTGRSNPSEFDNINPGVNRSLPQGRYVLKINEQINEREGIIGSHRIDDCQGGFTYYHIPIVVEFDEEEGIQTYIDTGDILIDPNESDHERMRDAPLPPPPPCAEFYDKDSERCKAVPTALFGTISTDPAGFIGDIFSWVIGIAGLGALVLLIYSGYLIMFSQGDQEKIQQARENIKSAVIGLLFVVFSIVILEILGVDILGIPELGR